MVDSITTEELDEIYRRIERKIDVDKATQKQILDFLTAKRSHYIIPKLTIKPRKTKGIRDLSRRIKEIINILKIKSYTRNKKKISGYKKTITKWDKQQEKYILDNPKMPLKELSRELGKTYHSLRTKRQRLLGIKK